VESIFGKYLNPVDRVQTFCSIHLYNRRVSKEKIRDKFSISVTIG